MSKKLIIVADDFGFSEAYSLGAMKAYQKGAVTVLSLMSNMDFAPQAVNLWKKECPEANLALHVNFVQGKPVSQDVTSMTDENGMFYRSSQWAPTHPNDTKCKGTVVVSYEDAKKETWAQLERYKELVGCYPNHFEGHSVGTANIIRAFEEVAQELNIHCMTQREESERLHYGHELLMSNPKAIEVLNRGARVEDFTEDIFGLLNSPYEHNILHFHPGYLDAYVIDNTSLTIPRVRDLEALCDPRVLQWFQENNIELVDFNSLYQ